MWFFICKGKLTTWEYEWTDYHNLNNLFWILKLSKLSCSDNFKSLQGEFPLKKVNLICILKRPWHYRAQSLFTKIIATTTWS